MSTGNTIDLDQLRKEFSERIRALIAEEKTSNKVESFSNRTRTSLRQISQWSSAKQVNWPSVQSMAQMCHYANISPSWLLFGEGPKHLSKLKEARILIDELVTGEIVKSVAAEGSPGYRRIAASDVSQTTRIDQKSDTGALPPRRARRRRN